MADKDFKYSTLIKRIDLALSHEFYLEASWIAYAILEDRLVSALRESGGAVNHNGKEIFMMGLKLSELRNRMPTSLNLRKAFFGNMLDRLHVWKDKRNDLMHAMAGENHAVSDLDSIALEVATDGKELAREFCAACRRFKKFNRK